MKTSPDLALERILAALETEVVEATDEELSASERELGMRPEMKGSAAFIGITVCAPGIPWQQRLSQQNLASPEEPTNRRASISNDIANVKGSRWFAALSPRQAEALRRLTRKLVHLQRKP
jgi:hypothetical protein